MRMSGDPTLSVLGTPPWLVRSKGTIIMGTNTFFKDALPISISGPVGTGTVSLLDLLKQTYGEDASRIQNVSIFTLDAAALAASNLSYWDPNNKVLTHAVAPAGVDLGNIGAAHFKDVQIVIGNNIAPNLFLTVPESFTPASGDSVGHNLAITALPQQLDAPFAADHIPTAADIVSTARMIATAENGVANANDCHNIASAIAASAGATLDSQSANTTNVSANEESGFWRIAYRGNDAAIAVDDWQSKVQAGDIVRMQRTDGGVHTVTVTAGLNADGNHPGQIQVVDNSNGIISEHWQDYDNNTVRSSVTIYRLTTDGVYLNDQHTDGHNNTILGSQFNDAITAGVGSDTLSGGNGGNDTLDGGNGDDTAVFHGKQSDYKVTLVNATTAILTDQRAGSPDGTDTIKNIEHVQFSDGPVDFAELETTAEPAPVAGSVSISDVNITEGNNGSQIETFTVTRTGGSAAFDVDFATADGSATVADGDYVAKTGSVHFDAGVNTQTISIVVNGDTKVEANESFNVNLSDATNGATVAKAQGVSSIVNDDAAPVAGSVAISDVNITEGDNGSQIETFTVTRTGGSAAFDVDFATADGSATTADGDYVANTGKVHFDAGVNTQTVSIVVNGDTKVEANESFNVNLSGATNGATIAKAQGVSTIVNDDATPVSGSVAISDVNITEGDNGSQIETFTVTRTGGSAAFDVDFATADGSATAADGDYLANTGSVHFDAGVNTQTISIVVNGDTKVEANETFSVNLSAATNGATIADGQGVGTIVNDDAAATHHVPNDFNGDGISDVLFRNSSGSVAVWELNGNHIDLNATVGSAGSNWHETGIGDFNGDGKADLLWRNDQGGVAMWQLDGNHIASNTTVGSASSDWKIVDVADFSGDGKVDILWENSQGKVAMWQMDGDHIASNTTVGSVGTDWKVIGTDDFNGDGKADILWENSQGKVAMWQMDGDHIASNTTVGSVGSNWHAAGTGDFNGDGKADVLWQNDQGGVAMWQMDGDHIASNTTVGSAAGWSVISTGDYNDDGKADVLWQNASGNVAQWQMDGDDIAANLTVGSHSIDWHAV
ncbi:aspartate 1-decarboxylase [Bradyrhizobium sp. OAE829]